MKSNGHKKLKVLVAMSGGVDSAVAAYLLKKEGHEVVGMTLRVHDDLERNRRLKSCCAPMDIGDAREVARVLQIPYYTVDMREEFHQRVMVPFAENYRNGKTPNPCVLCNQDLKFGLLYQRAKALGMAYVATGHYARLKRKEKNERIQLLKGRDVSKDQSYFLFSLDQNQLAHMLLPLGDLTKKEVRKIARDAGLPLANKAESQEICFVPDNQYAKVVEKIIPNKNQDDVEGKIVNEWGEILGTHKGIHYFTIGQRKGLGLSYPEPLYVLRIDPSLKRVVVGPESSLGQKEFLVEKVHWISQNKEEVLPGTILVKIRSHHHEKPATIFPLANQKVQVVFEEPQRAIAPGQAAVFYCQDEVLGGGWISR